MAARISTDSKVTSQHVEEGVPQDDIMNSDIVKDWGRLKEDANLATEDEHNTTFIQAVRRYPKAAFWSAVVSLCIIMDGYDTALISTLFGFPAFQKKYGHKINDSGKYTLDAQWQVALGMSNPLGNIIGVILNGYLTDRFGHKKVLHGALLVLTGFIFIQVFAPDVRVLFVGELLAGIPWGMFSTMAPAFASEVSPLVLRSYLETWVVVCWGIGQFFSYAVLFSLKHSQSNWAYRIPFAIQWVWPVIIFPLALFCPESPWWLVRKGRYDKAEHSVMRLTSAPSQEMARGKAKQAVALMIETNRLEQDMTRDSSYLACFKGTNLRRTEIACATWGIQILTGFVIQAYATYFFQEAGLNSDDSFKMTLGIGAIHLVCNFSSSALSGNYGRRPLFLSGCVILSILMFLIGFLAFGPGNSAFGFATSSIYLVWFGVWCLSIGPLPYIINGEVSSTKLRAKTITLARGVYLILNIINSVVAPYILNPQWANWRGKTGLLTGGLTVLSLTWAYFRLPETGGRTYEELDILFAQEHLSARAFSKAVIHRDGEAIRVTGRHVDSNGNNEGTR
jgi:SP family general alpha glucoside:H+ symporter-like MFS transporter